mgnify:FL=1
MGLWWACVGPVLVVGIVVGFGIWWHEVGLCWACGGLVWGLWWGMGMVVRVMASSVSMPYDPVWRKVRRMIVSQNSAWCPVWRKVRRMIVSHNSA